MEDKLVEKVVVIVSIEDAEKLMKINNIPKTKEDDIFYSPVEEAVKAELRKNEANGFKIEGVIDIDCADDVVSDFR